MDNNNKVLVIPYVSNNIKWIVKNFVDVRYTIPKKLDSIIRKDKDSLKDYQMTEIVYKINCKDCDQVYIGIKDILKRE